ncbi:MAG: FISUMP domain-containing protein [Candidatus Falkowbacteria bacterium]
MTRRKLRAFTLIELLVVIAIIGILATMATIALQSARAKSRDARRVADVKQMQTALELFFNDQNRYPTASELAAGSIYSTSTNGTTTYMAIIPTPPTPADNGCSSSDNNKYFYSPSGDGTSYTISYCLGGPVGGMPAGGHCASPAGINMPGDCGWIKDGGFYVAGVSCRPACTGGQVCSAGVCQSPPAAPCSASTLGESSCSYGGENYPTVTINGKILLAKNLNIGTMVNSASSTQSGCVGYNNNGYWSCQTSTSPVNNPEKYCYNNDAANCATDGGLYEWTMAMGLPNHCQATSHVCDGTTCVASVTGYSDCNFADPDSTSRQGICPSGWHLPSKTEYLGIKTALATGACGNGMSWTCAPAGDSFKKALNNPVSGNNGCVNPNDGICGMSGFNLLLSGERAADGAFYSRNIDAYLWIANGASTYGGSDFRADYNRVTYSNAYIYSASAPEGNGFPIRCIRN